MRSIGVRAARSEGWFVKRRRAFRATYTGSTPEAIDLIALSGSAIGGVLADRIGQAQ